MLVVVIILDIAAAAAVIVVEVVVVVVVVHGLILQWNPRWKTILLLGSLTLKLFLQTSM